jgi:hypothetical protein
MSGACTAVKVVKEKVAGEDECNICHETGHQARACPNKGEDQACYRCG